MGKGIRIPVHLGERSYEIWVTQDRLRALGGLLRRLRIGQTAVVVANPDAFRNHGPHLLRALRRAGFDTHLLRHFPTKENSEKAKSWEYARRLIRDLVHLKKSGSDLFLLCFAGGVLGDLTGFVASIYKRGIPYVQVPTTLLAQVDSAIGGKTAIDLPEGKNLVGAFHQPRLVYSDISILQDLPLESLRQGLSEAIKYGVIQSERFFRLFETSHRGILKRDPMLLQKIVETCSRMKARIVEQDEYDRKKKRMILNYGHTLGHALEAVDIRIGHGNAISVGMLLEADIAEGLGLLPGEAANRLEHLLKKIGLPTTVSQLYNHRRWTVARILEAERYDKKFVHGRNRYVLPMRIGKVVVKEGIPYSLIRHVLKDRLT